MSVCSHPKIKLEGVPYEVDSGISGLIQKITDRGIRTFDSCEDSFNGGRIFIYFNSGIDIQSFMDVLFASGVDESDQLYMRIKSNTDEGPDAWQYITGVHPIVAKPGEKPTGVTVAVSVEFPAADYYELLRRF
jgi:hypothetical protein